MKSGALFFPERVALLGVLAYLALWLIAPLDRVYPVSLGSLVYIALCYGCFVIGCMLFRGLVARPRTTGFPVIAFWIIAALGALGFALRIYDKLFIRGINIADTALEARELLSSEGTGLVAAMGGALYPLCYVPLIILWTRPNMGAVAKWSAIGLFVLPWLDALLVLSRSLMISAFFMAYFACACVLYRGRALPPRLVKIAILGPVVLGAISVLVFYERLDQMGVDIVWSILTSAYGYVLTPNASVLGVLSEEGALGSWLRAIVPMFQYYLHGIFEFGLLWEQPEQVFTHGVQHFNPYVKLLSVLGVMSAPEYNFSPYYREGVFTSFFGPLWVDFGWFGPALMLLFGIACETCAKAARHGVEAAVPLHAYLCVVVFLMPVCNFIVSAQGMYVINAFLMLWLFAPRQVERAAHARAPTASMCQ